MRSRVVLWKSDCSSNSNINEQIKDLDYFLVQLEQLILHHMPQQFRCTSKCTNYQVANQLADVLSVSVASLGSVSIHGAVSCPKLLQEVRSKTSCCKQTKRGSIRACVTRIFMQRAKIKILCYTQEISNETLEMLQQAYSNEAEPGKVMRVAFTLQQGQ